VSLLGLEHVVVAVNKMDLVDYDEATYEKIKNEYVAFADQLNISKIDFIPLSALKGDNVVNPSENMNWYKGPALLPFLEEVEQTIDQIADGFQLPVQYVNRPNADFRGYCGTLNRGSVAPGDSITVLPSGLTTTVERVIGANGDVDRADSGMAITLTLATEIDISRGDVLVHTQHSFEISNQKKLRSHLVWMDQTPLALDKDYELKLGTRRVNARVDIIHHRVDINTLENVDADTLELNEIGLLDVQLDALLPIQQFTHNKGLGAFILIDKITNATVAAGMISSQQADMVDHHRAEFHIADANKELEGKSAEQIVKWALALEGKAIVTTNFGPQEAVLLQMVNQVAPETEVLWIDSGYNMPQTYKFADAVAKQLDLNLTVYTPLVSAARRDAVMGGIPMIDDPAHEEFSRQFKIEPFLRAMKDTNADVWLTAVRREQTAVRQAMDTVALGPNDVIKVSPLLDWTLADMQAYLKKNGLPDETRYFDPTKVEAGRECGLHTLGD
jgi:phosphoadenylyl-sulfate reductase (thioredoxin)